MTVIRNTQPREREEDLTGGAFTFRHSPDFFRCLLSTAFDVGFSVAVCRLKIHDDSRGKNHRVTGMSS